MKFHPGTTTVTTTAAPKALAQCSYNDDKTLKTSFMEECMPNLVCRSKEKLVSTYVTMSNKLQVKKCCCDYSPSHPVSNKTAEKILAPQCDYNRDGSINTWSVVSAGDDLICEIGENLMTFDLGSDKNGSKEVSCCLRKDATTIVTTLRTTPLCEFMMKFLLRISLKNLNFQRQQQQ